LFNNIFNGGKIQMEKTIKTIDRNKEEYIGDYYNCLTYAKRITILPFASLIKMSASAIQNLYNHVSGVRQALYWTREKDHEYQKYDEMDDNRRYDEVLGEYEAVLDNAYLLVTNKLKGATKFKSLWIRISETQTKKLAYAKEHSVRNFKAKLVACPSCESKVNKKFVKYDKCPVCDKDLRSKTTINTLRGYEDKIIALKNEADIEYRKLYELNFKK
jgi:hypothetical protein